MLPAGARWPRIDPLFVRTLPHGLSPTQFAFNLRSMERLNAKRQADEEANRPRKSRNVAAFCMLEEASEACRLRENELNAIITELNTLKAGEQLCFMKALVMAKEGDTESANWTAVNDNHDALRKEVLEVTRKMRVKEVEFYAAQQQVQEDMKLRIAVVLD